MKAVYGESSSLVAQPLTKMKIQNVPYHMPSYVISSLWQDTEDRVFSLILKKATSRHLVTGTDVPFNF